MIKFYLYVPRGRVERTLDQESGDLRLVPAESLNSDVSLGSSRNPSGLQFPHLKNEGFG